MREEAARFWMAANDRIVEEEVKSLESKQRATS